LRAFEPLRASNRFRHLALDALTGPIPWGWPFAHRRVALAPAALRIRTGSSIQDLAGQTGDHDRGQSRDARGRWSSFASAVLRSTRASTGVGVWPNQRVCRFVDLLRSVVSVPGASGRQHPLDETRTAARDTSRPRGNPRLLELSREGCGGVKVEPERRRARADRRRVDHA
jgi:hypothetical protein